MLYCKFSEEIASTGEVYILLDHLYKRGEYLECLYCSIYFYKRGTSTREVLLQERYFYKKSTSTREVSSRPTLTIGAVPVSPHAVSLAFGFFLPVGHYKVVSPQLGLYCLIHFISRDTGWSRLFLDWRTCRSSILSRILALPKVASKAYILPFILCVLGC